MISEYQQDCETITDGWERCSRAFTYERKTKDRLEKRECVNYCLANIEKWFSKLIDFLKSKQIEFEEEMDIGGKHIRGGVLDKSASVNISGDFFELKEYTPSKIIEIFKRKTVKKLRIPSLKIVSKVSVDEIIDKRSKLKITGDIPLKKEWKIFRRPFSNDLDAVLDLTFPKRLSEELLKDIKRKTLLDLNIEEKKIEESIKKIYRENNIGILIKDSSVLVNIAGGYMILNLPLSKSEDGDVIIVDIEMMSGDRKEKIDKEKMTSDWKIIRDSLENIEKIFDRDFKAILMKI